MNRLSNFELLRIIAMLMIVLLHANFFSLGTPYQNDIITTPLASFWRILAEQLCIVGVNVYILISGWFGIKPTAKGLCSLIFQVIFWGCLIILVALAFNIHIPIEPTLKVFWFGSYYWFVISYVGLYVISPVLNAFIYRTTAKHYFAVLICYFAVEFVYGWLFDSEYMGGSSIISFIGLYLLGRFFRLHSIKLRSIKPAYCFLFYLLTTLIPVVISFCGIRNNWNQFHPIYYSSPFVIAAATFFFLAFSKTEFYSKAINWIACSTFSVYLIHLHPIVLPYFKTEMIRLSDSLSTFSYTFSVVPIAMGLLLVCTVFDKFRILCWRYLCSLFLDSFFFKFEELFNRITKKMGY